MKQPSGRPRRIDPDNDEMWESLAREASARLPQNLAPPLSEPSPPSSASPPEPEPEVIEAEPAAAPRKRRGPRTSRYQNITRFDYGNTHGYFVRLSWKHDRRSKFFSDGRYHDRLDALAAAIAWRDRTTREMGKPTIATAPSKKKSVGVHRRTKDGREVYEATWYENGRHRRTSFSIRKHGEKEARALAVAARQRALSSRHKND